MAANHALEPSTHDTSPPLNPTQYPPVRRIAEASLTGHATNVIAGVAVGLEATGAPVLVMSLALVTSFWLGNSSGLVEGGADGLFGTAVATMGMLSTAAYVLTMDIFGPIADNAGGIVEMSGQPEAVRAVTDVLDAVGNTTKVGVVAGAGCLHLYYILLFCIRCIHSIMFFAFVPNPELAPRAPVLNPKTCARNPAF